MGIRHAKTHTLRGKVFDETRVKAPQYKRIKGSLYKKSFLTPWLRCIITSQADNIVKEIHESSFGFSTEPCSVVVKVMKQGYYWPSIYRDATKIIQDCTRCQEHSMEKKVSRKDAILVGNRWPFSHWGVNILGPLPMAPESLKFLAIAMEHSTKWVEAKPLTRMNEKQAEKFAWEHIVCRAHRDNEPHREAVGSMPTRMGDDLARLLWVYRTLLRNSQNRQPFSLAYVLEAIIPSLESLAPEVKGYATKENAKRKEVEEREVASIKEAYYQNKLRRYNNIRSNHSIFKLGDFVLLSLRSTDGQQVRQGPHMVSEVYKGDLFKITDAFDYSLVQT
ncbi:reverse transcriptase domain-containing protein [Tanacetum coccineum]